MTAKEAREKAEASTNSERHQQQTKIITEISIAASKGQMKINIYEYVREDVRVYLEGLGYSVGKNYENRGEYYCEISW